MNWEMEKKKRKIMSLIIHMSSFIYMSKLGSYLKQNIHIYPHIMCVCMYVYVYQQL